MPPVRALARLVGDRIELHLADRGYAGLVRQEDGSGSLCLAVRRSRLREAGGPERLSPALGTELPQLGEQMARRSSDTLIDAVANVAYGWHATGTAPGVFRLADQAGVIPSPAGKASASRLPARTLEPSRIETAIETSGAISNWIGKRESPMTWDLRVSACLARLSAARRPGCRPAASTPPPACSGDAGHGTQQIERHHVDPDPPPRVRPLDEQVDRRRKPGRRAAVKGVRPADQRVQHAHDPLFRFEEVDEQVEPRARRLDGRRVRFELGRRRDQRVDFLPYTASISASRVAKWRYSVPMPTLHRARSAPARRLRPVPRSDAWPPRSVSPCYAHRPPAADVPDLDQVPATRSTLLIYGEDLRISPSGDNLLLAGSTPVGDPIIVRNKYDHVRHDSGKAKHVRGAGPDEKMDHLPDYIAITDLVQRYRQGTDTHDFDLLRTCYGEDIEVDHSPTIGWSGCASRPTSGVSSPGNSMASSTATSTS
ncbi:nuclear transport factor 2 family protein [uncultured Sphingomonas sp.]|uniref:nuclear transport factor 2 family protein n=1 Tax=uncultured Sphingomonas sp. TaxID=158754 RepID=UPI0025F19F73|nr:nuclear transport factor 2 family protein [uncultured Sphingomonas sp.]